MPRTSISRGWRSGWARSKVASGWASIGCAVRPIVSWPDSRVVIADDVAEIIRRADLLGIPAWRVMTALGIAQAPTYRAAGIAEYRAD